MSDLRMLVVFAHPDDETFRPDDFQHHLIPASRAHAGTAD